MTPFPKALLSLGSRLGATAQNALEVARFGGLNTDETASPYEVVAEQRVYRLRHYFPAESGAERPAVLLVPPLMITAEVYDISAAVSAVGVLHTLGVDPWVVDFGAPEREPGGLERDLTDHVLAVSDAIDRIRSLTGKDVHLAGYSQGGMFCYQVAAYRRSAGIESVVTFGSPADTHAGLPFGFPGWLAEEAAALIPDRLLGTWAVPGWVTRAGFQLASPVKSVRSRVEFLRGLHDRERLAPKERQRRFMQGEGWVAWPGPALAELVRQFVEHNRMLTGGFVIGDRLVTLADIACPVLSFVGLVDEIAPAAAVRGIIRAAPRTQVYEASLRTGHFGLVAGSLAARETWPIVAGWILWRAGQRDRPPEQVEPAVDLWDEPKPGRIGYGLELAAGYGGDALRMAATAAARAAHRVRGIVHEAGAQLPRLTRLQRIRPETPMSLGLLLDEQASRAPGDILFLFHGRAYTQAAAKRRIDSVVRGLIKIGVRQGESVGILMGTRPSALAAVAAISRLGAVAVLLRPDGDLARELELGQVRRIITDPENLEQALACRPYDTFLLGGAAHRDPGRSGAGAGSSSDQSQNSVGQVRDSRRRDGRFGDLVAGPDGRLGDDAWGAVVDMEGIDPDTVPIPAWFRANPGRAGDLAFVLFTGDGTRTRANRITNRRWALSAFGTASSAALSPADTVYSLTPLHHPSGLLMSIGGAVAGGARLALATAYDPTTFWDEARRYGVTVSSYTWTLLRDLVNAPPHPGERHHSLRLFVGSGMPRGLWRRIEDRFAPARVLEFYASTEGEAVLVNLSGRKPGSLGRPLPGSADVRLARYDLERGEIEQGPGGLAIDCDVNEVGMLLARVSAVQPDAPANVLRGVFEAADAWTATGDLFRRDAGGDFWLVGRATDLIRTREGIVPPVPMREVLGDLPGVDVAVAYGIPVGDEGREVAAAAITLRASCEVRPVDFTEALMTMEPSLRPALIRIVDEIPVTGWHRLDPGPLRAEGVPLPGDGRTFYRDKSGGYRILTDTARRRLLRSA
jgi:putative long chain acyl-CoA synthase